MEAKKLLNSANKNSVSTEGASTRGLAEFAPSTTLAINEVRKDLARGKNSPSAAPRGQLLDGVGPIERKPVHVTLPDHFEATLFTEKFIPSIVNSNQAIAKIRGDVVIIPKDTVVCFEGQTMTLIASAPLQSGIDNGYVRIFSNQLYTNNSGKPIRFAFCPGRTPVGSQFQLRARFISTADAAASLIDCLQRDIGIGTGAVLLDRRAA